jgi:hypothetical protein
MLFAFLAIVATFALVAIQADAAPRSNFGSRGSRTFSAPPPTATAPKAASPINRTMTQPGAATAARPGVAAAGAAAPAAGGGFFNRPGLLGGLAAGFLGAGLFGMLAGHGFGGGLGGIASFLGLLLQIGIVAGVALLAWRWWQSRSQPARLPPAGRHCVRPYRAIQFADELRRLAEERRRSRGRHSDRGQTGRLRCLRGCWAKS